MGQRQSDPQFASITEKRKPDMLRYFSQMIAHLYQNAEICEGHDWTGGERGDGGAGLGSMLHTPLWMRSAKWRGECHHESRAE